MYVNCPPLQTWKIVSPYMLVHIYISTAPGLNGNCSNAYFWPSLINVSGHSDYINSFGINECSPRLQFWLDKIILSYDPIYWHWNSTDIKPALARPRISSLNFCCWLGITLHINEDTYKQWSMAFRLYLKWSITQDIYASGLTIIFADCPHLIDTLGWARPTLYQCRYSWQHQGWAN